MKPTTSLLLKYQFVNAAIAFIGASVQWYKAGWRSGLFVFFWVFVLLNLPVAYYVAKNALSAWWQRQRP